jgi:hypothetical protein
VIRARQFPQDGSVLLVLIFTSHQSRTTSHPAAWGNQTPPRTTHKSRVAIHGIQNGIVP